MSYKSLIKQIIALLVNPAEAWQEVAKEKGTQNMFANFVYPLMALTAFVAFVCKLIYSKGGVAFPIFQSALTFSCATAVAILAGVYVAPAVLDALFKTKWFKGVSYERDELTKLVGYGFVVVFLYFMLTSLVPQLWVILYMVQFYVIYIIWHAMDVLVFPSEDNKMKSTWLIGCTILGIPSALYLVFIFAVNLIN